MATRARKLQLTVSNLRETHPHRQDVTGFDSKGKLQFRPQGLLRPPLPGSDSRTIYGEGQIGQGDGAFPVRAGCIAIDSLGEEYVVVCIAEAPGENENISSVLAYPLGKLSTSTSLERQTPKKRRTGKGTQGSTSVSEIETTVTKKLVEVSNIVAFAKETEAERGKLLATLSSDNLGIFADYTTSGDTLEKWLESPDDRLSLVEDNLKAILSNEFLGKFSQPLEQMSGDKRKKVDEQLKLLAEVAKALTAASRSLNGGGATAIEVEDKVAEYFPAHLQHLLPKRQRKQKTVPRPKKRRTSTSAKKHKRGVGQGKGGGRTAGAKQVIVNKKVYFVPPGVTLAQHMMNLGISTAGSPICVGEQGVHEDASRTLFDLEVNDFKEKELKYQERIAESEAQENATKTLIGMRDAAWESAFNQAITIAKMAVLTQNSPNRDLVEEMIEGIKKPTDLRTVSVSQSRNVAAREV